MAKSSSNAVGTGCLLLFALPFAAVGVGVAIWMAHTVLQFVEMQQWVATPATIIQVDLVSNSDGDGTTYQVTATYTYEVNGRSYTGHRVGIEGGSDNIGKWHEHVYRELQAAKEAAPRASDMVEYDPSRSSPSSVVCYVDPDDPSNAVLKRDLRWGMLAFQSIFVLAFGGVGIGMIVGGLRQGRSSKIHMSLATAHPAEPWRWKKDWASGVIQSGSRAQMIFAVIFATFWTVVSSPVIFFIPDELKKGNTAVLIGLLFPLVGVGLIIWAVRATIRWIKFGKTTFQMAAVPGVVGGRVAGVVRVPRSVQPAAGFKVRLSCINRVTTGSGKNRNTRENVLWQDERVVAHEVLRSDPSFSAVPVLFHAPFGMPSSSEEDPSDQVIWRLEVTADIPGVDYLATFDLPVFVTAESSPDFKLDPSAIQSYEVKTDPERVLRDERIVVERRHPHHLIVVFPRAARPMQALVITGIFLVWTAVLVVITLADAPIIFPIVFGLFELLIFYGVIDAWLGTARIEVTGGTLQLSGGIFFTGKTGEFPAAAVEGIEAVSGQQQGKAMTYNVVIRTGGKSIVAGRPIVNRMAADVLARLLLETLGL